MTKIYSALTNAARAARKLVAAGKAPAAGYQIRKADGGFYIAWIVGTDDAAAAAAADTAREEFGVDVERELAGEETETETDAEPAPVTVEPKDAALAAIVAPAEAAPAEETVSRETPAAPVAAERAAEKRKAAEARAVLGLNSREADIKSALDMGFAGDRKSARAAVEKLHRLGAEVPAELIAKAKGQAGGGTAGVRKVLRPAAVAAEAAKLPKPGSVGAAILAMLTRPEGATIPEVAEAVNRKDPSGDMVRVAREAGYVLEAKREGKRSRFWAVMPEAAENTAA